jgi:hypothetical protein
MGTVLFWIVAVEIGAVAACITAVAKLEIRRRTTRRRPQVAPKKFVSPVCSTKLSVTKKVRGYDYPELGAKDSSDRQIKIHKVLMSNVQMH